jgi:Fe-S cluster biosynthesis and repair protein YggX
MSTQMTPELAKRIEQWEKMAAEVPDEMAFFSLGSAYREAGRHEDAVAALRKSIEFDAGMSRAYQFLGECLMKLGREDEAGPVLTEGYKTAASRGDVMPQRSIEAMLKKLMIEPPAVQSIEERAVEVAEKSEGRLILDRKSGQPQPKLDGPPMRGALGEYIFEHYGQVTWNQWIRQGTKVINELRLDFSNPSHQDTYEQHMIEWLGIDLEAVKAFSQA